MDFLNRVALDNFREYLKIDTSHPNPDYYKAVQYLKNQANELQLEFNVIELAPENPIVIMKWNGKNNKLRSIALNSHMDVVPVFPDEWKYHPFSADIDDDGNIYARGSQDMKCVGIQYLEAIRRIKTFSPSYLPERDIYVFFVPDEEKGGQKGLKLFVDSDHFTSINIGIFMDEGIASPVDSYPVFYGERYAILLTVSVSGTRNSYCSQPKADTTWKRMCKILNKFMDYRNSEETRMIDGGLLIGDVTTINLTGMSGRVQSDGLSENFALNFDIRVNPLINSNDFLNMLYQWADDVGGDIEYKFVAKSTPSISTCIDSSNPWWVSLEMVCQNLGMEIVPQIFPAGTDSRFVRAKGISAIGFSPMNWTPVLLHDHNEFLNVDTFVRGISFYEKLIPALAAVVEDFDWSIY